MADVHFSLALLTPLLNVSKRTHWARERRSRSVLCGLVKMATHGQRPRVPFPRAHLRVGRRSVGTPDWDGLVGGMKALIDTLVAPGAPRLVRGRWQLPHPFGLGIIEDDGPGHLTVEPLAIRVRHLDLQGTDVSVWQV